MHLHYASSTCFRRCSSVLVGAHHGYTGWPCRAFLADSCAFCAEGVPRVCSRDARCLDHALSLRRLLASRLWQSSVLILTSPDSTLLAVWQHDLMLICRPGRPAQLVAKQLWYCGLLKSPKSSHRGAASFFGHGKVPRHAAGVYQVPWPA